MDNGLDFLNITEAAQQTPRRQLVSLGDDTHFLDAILGELLPKSEEDVSVWEERPSNTDYFTPSAPFMECESLENTARELHNLEEFLDNSFLELERCDDDIAQEGTSQIVPASENMNANSSSHHLLDLVSSPAGCDPCEMTRCDSWEFSSLGNTESLPCHVKERSPSCTSVDSITQFDSFIEKLSQSENKTNDEEILAIECQCRRDDLQRSHRARVSMFLPRSHEVLLPKRPRSASPTLPAAADDATSSQPDSNLVFDSLMTQSTCERTNTVTLPWKRRMRSSSLTTFRPQRIGRLPRANSFSSAEMASKLAAITNCQTTEDAAEASTSRPTNWLRMSMRRVRHFRLVDPPSVDLSPSAPPESPQVPRPASAPVNNERPRQYGRAATRRPLSASAEGVTRPSRGQRRRISSSRRRSAAAVESPAPEHDWTRHRLSSDSSSDSDSIPAQTSTTQGTEGTHSNLRTYEMTRNTQSPLGQWPHGLSSMLACLGTTLGLFNISRFAILSVQFGANFILQFLFMSLLLGIPLFTFHVSLGQLLASGTMDMWRISPVFQGIGIALLMSQALFGIYSIVGVSWIFVYFRDSFITKQDIYRWAEPYASFRDDGRPTVLNSSAKLEETVPDYFNGVVLQRHNLDYPANTPGHLKFQLTFNLAVVWMLVFISLSKGLKSYGKVVYLFSLVPIFGMLVLCSKLLGLTPSDSNFQLVFPETDWSEFFLNTKSWVAASSEAFYTWGILGASAMQIASHNRPKHFLHRDASLVIVLTLSILMLAAFLANTCAQILLSHGYLYLPSSFERISTYTFLYSVKNPLPQAYAATPYRWLPHTEFMVGSKIYMPGSSPRQQSGYQVLRLATELVPSTLALIGANRLSPFWSVLFYFVLILFGISQQLAIWHCLITGIMAINVKKLKSWETTITFFTCACGFVLGLPMTTELGIFVVYFLDYCVGGGWWLIIIYLSELAAVFLIRGRPYSGETVVAALFSRAGSCLQTWIAPLLSFVWNVILPVLLMVLSVTIFKNGQFRDFFKWHAPMFYDYWPGWTREFGSMLQVIPLLMIPFIGVVQTCRYLSSGPPDIFDRIQLLYRPPLESVTNLQDLSTQTDLETTTTTSNNPVVEDPPPKYTPPPSYTTATGARIAKLLRQSFRRSCRRITNVFGNGEASALPAARVRQVLPPPPDYSAVLVEINQALATSNQNEVVISVNEANNDRTHNTLVGGEAVPATSTLTASDVATILRSSLRRNIRDNVIESSSSERLVDAAAPINLDSVVLETLEIDKEELNIRH